MKSLLHNHLVYICAEKTDFDRFVISLLDKTENPLWHSSQVINRSIQKESLSVCDHEIIQIMYNNTKNLLTQGFSINAATEGLVSNR